MLRVCFVENVGIFYAAKQLGRAVAFIGGGFLLQFYTHFDTVDTSASVVAVFI